MKKGICNKCGKVYDNSAPNIGYFCGNTLYKEVTLPGQETTKLYIKCDGIVVRHEVALVETRS